MTEPIEPAEWAEDDLKGNDIHPPIYLPETADDAGNDAP